MTQKPYPPYGRQLVVSGLRIILLYVGEPDCWRQAENSRKQGFNHHLCLPDPADADKYSWPVENCHIAVIIYCPISADIEARLIGVLSVHQANDIAVRHWPYEALIVHRFTS